MKRNCFLESIWLVGIRINGGYCRYSDLKFYKLYLQWFLHSIVLFNAFSMLFIIKLNKKGQSESFSINLITNVNVLVTVFLCLWRESSINSNIYCVIWIILDFPVQKKSRNMLQSVCIIEHTQRNSLRSTVNSFYDIHMTIYHYKVYPSAKQKLKRILHFVYSAFWIQFTLKWNEKQ